MLIVRDEQEALPDCLASLTGVVDEIHVHDTGSTDGTVELARAAGAVVTEGEWTGDFAAARNAAVAGWCGDWALSVDADERVRADASVLRDELAASRYDALLVDIDNRHDALPYTHRGVRLFRPDRVRWEGRVHEQLVGPSGVAPAGVATRTAIVLDHLGYEGADVRRAKSERNAALAQQALDELLAGGPAARPEEVARTLLDLGRSLAGAERRQEAVDAFEAAREFFPGSPEALQATDGLARLLLGAAMDAEALALTEAMRAEGAPGPYCDWLAAQALAQLGDVERAWRLVSSLTQVVDVAGRRFDPAQLEKFVGLLRELRQTTPAAPRLRS